VQAGHPRVDARREVDFGAFDFTCATCGSAQGAFLHPQAHGQQAAKGGNQENQNDSDPSHRDSLFARLSANCVPWVDGALPQLAGVKV
jgi:hypothetical protein